jgi:hypothetical protein
LKKFKKIFITSEDGLSDKWMEIWLNGREEVFDIRFSNLFVGRHRRVDIGS